MLMTFLQGKNSDCRGSKNKQTNHTLKWTHLRLMGSLAYGVWEHIVEMRRHWNGMKTQNMIWRWRNSIIVSIPGKLFHHNSNRPQNEQNEIVTTKREGNVSIIASHIRHRMSRRRIKLNLRLSGKTKWAVLSHLESYYSETGLMPGYQEDNQKGLGRGEKEGCGLDWWGFRAGIWETVWLNLWGKGWLNWMHQRHYVWSLVQPWST